MGRPRSVDTNYIIPPVSLNPDTLNTFARHRVNLRRMETPVTPIGLLQVYGTPSIYLNMYPGCGFWRFCNVFDTELHGQWKRWLSIIQTFILWHVGYKRSDRDIEKNRSCLSMLFMAWLSYTYTRIAYDVFISALTTPRYAHLHNQTQVQASLNIAYPDKSFGLILLISLEFTCWPVKIPVRHDDVRTRVWWFRQNLSCLSSFPTGQTLPLFTVEYLFGSDTTPT